jgi:hypothetical protein
MPIINTPDTPLGRILVIGQRDGVRALWTIAARAERVPPRKVDSDEHTPGVHGMRTLWMRSVARPIATDAGATPFLDPILFDAFVPKGDFNGKFTLSIMGADTQVTLGDEQRIVLEPLREQPANTGEVSDPVVNVAPMAIASGTLSVPDPAPLAGLLPGKLDTAKPVDLDRFGLVYSALVETPKTHKAISTRVRLTLRDNQLTLELLPEQLTAQAAADWLAEWHAIATMAGSTRITAWARLDVEVGARPPALSWPVTRDRRGKMAVDWSTCLLPAGMVTVTLADQPVESQRLGPEQVMVLAPLQVRIESHGATLTVSAGTVTAPDLLYRYRAAPSSETLAFPKPLAMVHAPAAVRASLRLAYAGFDWPESAPLTGFLPESGGWVELPFAPMPLLPDKLGTPAAPAPYQVQAHGSMLVGVRRPELHEPGAVASQVPWSMRIDIPRAYDMAFVFQSDVLDTIDLNLQDCAMRARGMVWLANRAPDGHDALPAIDDDPSAWFDVVLDRAVPGKVAAPFSLFGLTVTAPARKGTGWDDASVARALRAPALAVQFGFSAHIGVLAGANKATALAWLRHPTLPVMQCMPGTRSDPSSPRPHASRALTLFTQDDVAELRFEGAPGMAPSIAAGQRTLFNAVADQDGVAPTLPGIIVRAQTPARYLAAGSYGLPMLDEEYARAALPLPPGAALPPPPPVVTALQKAALAALRAEQVRKRTNAAAQSGTMFGFGPIGTAMPLQALAAPRTVDASATVSAAVSVAGRQLQIGSVAFAQAHPAWDWAASGDALLAGPDAAIGFDTAGAVTIGSGAGRLVGWTFAERQAGAFTIDGRGVGWGAATVRLGELNLREILVETAGGQTGRVMASSIDALVVDGTGGPSWRLAFTDLALPGAGAATWTPAANADTRLASIENGWTWSLHEAGQWRIEPLSLFEIFQFAPSRLASVRVTAPGFVDSVVVEGNMTLVDADTSRSANSRCRVALTFVRNAQGNALVLDAIAPLDDPKGKRIYWDLDAARDASQVIRGVAQFSAVPRLAGGRLLLDDAWLDTTLFGSRTRIALKDAVVGKDACPVPLDAPAAPLVLGLTGLTLDLKAGRIAALAFTVKLREGLVVNVTETLSAGAAANRIDATTDWFGNITTWTAAIDDLRQTVRLFAPQQTQVTIFAGVLDGTVDDGVLCLTLDLAQANAQFAVLTHYCELVFAAGPSLCVSHLLHSDSPAATDSVRFDGTLARASLVEWPALEVAAVGTANSIDVQFDTAGQVTHAAAILLADHRLPGSAIAARKSGAGLALRPPAPGAAPVVWLAETTHTLTWWRGSGRAQGDATLTRTVQCLHPLQLWGAADLAAAIERHGAQFGFTPSYVGGVGAAGFPNQGVRKVAQAFTGLFEPGVSKAIEALGDSWIILGNMNALCQDAVAADLFQPLHLPFIGTCTLAESAALQALRGTLAVRATMPEKQLRMSRHDVLGLPLRIDATRATAAGTLATLPLAMPIPFARAALPGGAVSGAALAAGWFRTDGKPSEAGLQVEHIQLPGRSAQRPALPHPFPRAAVMLDFFRRRSVAQAVPALSVLVQSTGSSKTFAMKVATVQNQPAPQPGPQAGVKAAADLIVGSARGLVRQWIDADASGVGNARQLLASGRALTGEPTFLVVRQARVGGAAGDRIFTMIDLPPRSPDQLAFAARSLRSAQAFVNDGRLTWPEGKLEGTGVKRQLDLASAARTPFQHPPLGVAGLRGRIMPARVAGNVVDIQAAHAGQVPGASTVWLQEWEQVVFASVAGERGDAMPRAFDNPVAVRPLAPSANALARSLGRLDPTLLKGPAPRMQAYLPPVIEDIDLPTRTGTMTATGMRTLRTWDDGAGRPDVQALAGSAQTRAMRTPRPVAIPPNLVDSATWKRTLGWYGDPAASCLALAGRWDMLAAEPGENGVPPWCILLGRPTCIGVEPGPPGQEPIWRGALRLACDVFRFDANGAPERHPDPALFIIAVLRSGKSLRLGLRQGSAWRSYHDAVAFAPHILEFRMAPQGARFTSGLACQFECGWLVENGAFAGPGNVCLQLPAALAPAQALDPAAFRKLVLPVPHSKAGAYPLPLMQRSVFFSDPAFDRRLSTVNAVSASVQLAGKGHASLWLDRPSATPGETVALLGRIEGTEGTLTLTAKRKRSLGGKDDIVDLVFVVDGGGAPVPNATMPIQTGQYLALPLAMLADPGGARPAPGDILRLELTTSADATRSVVLFLPMRDRSALPAPEAVYSLIAVDAAGQRAWCALHSSVPQPEGLATHVKPDGSGIVRRGLFKWHDVQPVSAGPLSYSLCKIDLATEATHLPDRIEAAV